MSTESNIITAALSSITLHVILVGGLLAGAVLTTVKKPPTQVTIANDKPIVKAAMINQADVQKQLDKIKKKKLDEKLAQQRRDKKLKDEKRNIRKLEELKKKRLKEKNAADKAAKKARDDAKKQKKLADDAIKKSKAKQKSEAAKAKKLKDERIKQEKIIADAKAKKLAQEKAAKEQRRLEEQLAKELADEQAALNQARQAKVMSEIQKYTSLISSEIKRHWTTDQSMKGKECVLNIKLAPSGFVSSVKSVSGDPVVCQSARTAVLKANTLPVSKDPAVYAKLKEINLTVQPEFD